MLDAHTYTLALSLVWHLVGCQDSGTMDMLDGSVLDGGLVERDGGPAEGDIGPAEGDSGPADGDSGPADGDSGPADGDGGPADGDGGPADAGTLTTSRAGALRLYTDEYLPSQTETNGWTGMFDAPTTCVPGTIADDTRETALRRINYYRIMAGVAPIDAFDATLNQNAQAAALITLANVDRIFGEPPMSAHLPEPDWACYTEAGRQGAADGNISFGLAPVAEALDAFMEDSGPANGNVGHRRAMLNPHVVAMGIGATDRMVVQPNALAPDSERPNQFVGWPPAGFVPAPLLFPRWSMVNWQARGMAEAIVTMRDDAGAEIPVLMVGTSPRNANAVWEPQGELDLSDGATYHITIEGFTIRGDATPQRHEYTVRVVVP